MAAQRVFNLQQLTEHNSKQDCWLAIHGKVVDVTKFLEDHPGGDQVLLEVAGKEATKEFEDIGHSKVAKELVLEYQVGLLQGHKHSDPDDHHAALDDLKETIKVVGKEMTGFVIKDDVQQHALTRKVFGQLFDHAVPLAVVFALLWYRFSPLFSEMMN
ncbi:Flavonoid 3'5'-hydroxylase protein [Dioscorea alata]|uniref:Flavonoid 3'5'-hydroxylase protein n=1 Tax=Dioscorea alata TaxID=55571 RepID=A0ACB7TWN5_DIOAL|nr:Flavonoid 3'5'-hydroxylase protein [Dioscorea alata]